MRVMIHAMPARMWYVERFLLPQLKGQGVDDVTIWNDTEKRGNLGACLESFRSLTGDGGTWHIQDDVLLCRDFAKRAAENDEGVVNGFCCLLFGEDELEQVGIVPPLHLWHGFPCVRIPDEYARDFVRWIEFGTHTPYSDRLIRKGKGDDYLFHEYFRNNHRKDKARNIAPNLVEHVDWLLGGSVANTWREKQARSALWNEPESVDRLAEEIQKYLDE